MVYVSTPRLLKTRTRKQTQHLSLSLFLPTKYPTTTPKSTTTCAPARARARKKTHLKDWRLGVGVDRDDTLAVLHAGDVLDRAADADRDVKPSPASGLCTLVDLIDHRFEPSEILEERELRLTEQRASAQTHEPPAH